MSKRTWLWADGQMHDEPPPSSQLMVVAIPPDISLPPADARVIETVKRPDVPATFRWSPRSELRVKALDFVIRAESLKRTSDIGGEALIAQAEHLEKWIAATDRPAPRKRKRRR